LSGIRQNPSPWLADHVVFFIYRWLALALAALPLLWADWQPAYGWALLVAALLNVPATLFAQRYVRLARRTPAVMALDIFIMVLLLHMVRLSSGSEDLSDIAGVFVPYAYGSLVLPALLFGWRGGLMAGLAFVTMDRAALWSVRMPSAMTAFDWVDLALTMVAPPIFGSVLPVIVDLLRRASARRRQRRAQDRTPVLGGQPRREPRPDAFGFIALERDSEPGRQDEPLQTPVAMQATRVRAVEPSVEDLRRQLFAPFPSPDLDLVEALDLLALRFGQHTSAASRVVTLGRARRLQPAQRGVLVRLAQEALLNVQQHAHATSATCTLRYDATTVVLLLQDDGVGLLDGTYERPGLHALRAMHYRLAELGGRLDVFETEGGGVTVRATMPLE
jgi:glucose-6-phosphate-specific signal transduction histidine kinase